MSKLKELIEELYPDGVKIKLDDVSKHKHPIVIW